MALFMPLCQQGTRQIIVRSTPKFSSVAIRPTLATTATQIQPSNTNSSSSSGSSSSYVSSRNFSSLKGFRHRNNPISISDGDYTDYTSAHSTFQSNLNSNLDVDLSEDGSDWELDSNFEFDMERDKETKEQEAKLYELERDQEAKRRKWIETSKPPLRVPEIDERGRAFGKGGRKTATAQVWVYPGEGYVTVNGKDFLEYFPRDSHREDILGPMIATRTCGKFDIECKVEGGGKSGQAGAMRHGIARALEKYNPDYRPPMKALGFMTRDSRKVERKKVGLKKARKAPQWVKR